MFNFKSMLSPKDLSWIGRRLCAFLVGSPDEIKPELLGRDEICSRFDPEEAYEALKKAHAFLTSMITETLSMPEDNEGRIAVLEKSLYKIALLWVVGVCGELFSEGSERCLSFKKPLRSKIGELPSDYTQPFLDIEENGCWTEYFKGNSSVKDYNSCNNGLLHFDDGLTALGIHLFAKKCAQKCWYSETDIDDPVKNWAGPFYRADMRIFNCGERLLYDVSEQAAGYSDEMKKNLLKVYHFVKDNYPEYLPRERVYYGIGIISGISFVSKKTNRVLGTINIGYNDFSFSVLLDISRASGKVREALAETFGKGYQDSSLQIASEADADYVIKIMDIKAKYGSLTT